MKIYKHLASLAIFTALPVCTWADSPANSPAFSAGRPGNTESPLAVPQGFFQLESALASYTDDKQAGVRTDSWSLAQTSLRYGIGDDTDAQLVISPYSWQHTAGAGTIQGFGNTTLRLLHTFSGADGNSPAFGLIGFVTLPTASKVLKDGGIFADRTEGGLIATGTTSLTDKLSLTLTLGEAARHPDKAYVSDISGGANLTYAFTDQFGVYAEWFGDKVAYNPAVATVDFGATFLLDTVTQLDAGVNIGANDNAPDLNLFMGWSHRF